MTESAPAADLVADELPPELAALVQLGDDGSLTFSRRVRRPIRSFVVGAGAFAVASCAAFGVLALGVATRDPEAGAAGAVLLFGSPFVGLIAGSMASFGSARARADRDGLGGEPWDAASVRLEGNVHGRSARLVVEKRGGSTELILSWWYLAAHRTKGWDHDSVRWFAQIGGARAIGEAVLSARSRPLQAGTEADVPASLRALTSTERP
jgi:hypothetical protein